MEASALHAPARLGRLPLGAPLLRLRSDDQLVALFRAGSDEAFRVLHDRYRQRLFAYVRQMLSSQSRQDAEDVLQDVFVRAFGALRADRREINVRAWLYRVAHNRCIDHLRRPAPPPGEIFEMSRKPLHDPVEEAQRREDLKRLVADVARLPEQQRSALLMRELDGMSYADLATALDVTVPAVKSLLVRARIGLVEAQEARDADCGEIRRDLHGSYDRGVKASGRARRHLRECEGCREYRVALRGLQRSFAALAPGVGLGVGPVALVAKALGLGGAGGGAAAASGAGGGVVAVTGATAACKVAAVVCATAITAGGAVEMQRLARHGGAHERPRAERKAPARPAAGGRTVEKAPAVAASAAASRAPALHTRRPPRAAAPRRAAARRAKVSGRALAPAAAGPIVVGALDWADAADETVVAESGGVVAPEPAPAEPVTEVPPAAPPPETGTAAPGGEALAAETGGATTSAVAAPEAAPEAAAAAAPATAGGTAAPEPSASAPPEG